MATEREIQLVEAALKAAAEKCDELEQVATTMPASASQPAEQSEDDRERFERNTNDARFFPAELSFARTKSPSGRDEYANSHLQSRWEGWQAAKRDALTQAPQEQVEPTDAPSSFHDFALEAIGTVTLHDDAAGKALAQRYRALLSANQGKK